MGGIKYKLIEKSKNYKYVRKMMDHCGNFVWVVNGIGAKVCKTEREAAIAADKKLIMMGKQPVNILKPKEQ